MTTKCTDYKGGRHRPETALTLGFTPRGICVTCGMPKASHFQSS